MQGTITVHRYEPDVYKRQVQSKEFLENFATVNAMNAEWDADHKGIGAEHGNPGDGNTGGQRYGEEKGKGKGSKPDSDLESSPRSGVQLEFNGKTLTLSDNGKIVFSATAVSGRPSEDGTFDNSTERQKQKGIGSIPEGKYYINPQATQWWTDQGFLQRTYAIFKAVTWPGGLFSWGVARTWITPDGANVYGRSGFTIHGGTSPGSAGCIDLYGTSEYYFFTTLKAYSNLTRIDLIVKY